MSGELKPCPFCGCEMVVSSNRDWHRVVPRVTHDPMCLMAEDDFDIYVPATDDMRETMVNAWNVRATDPERATIRASLTSAEQLLAERDKRIAALELRIESDAKIMNDILVSNQAAWIEWRRGAGAEEAMVWVQNTLLGVGVPDESEPWAKEPQAWYSANKADPFPTCFCGRPSNHLWMGQGFCCDAHYDQGRAKAEAEAAGKTGLPIFDGKSPDTEGGSCD